ncbi:MAG TPA: heparinase II/III family protein [Verrucomicrobiae bacterium]
MNSSRLRFWIGICLAGVVQQSGQAADLPKALPPHPRLLFSQQDLPAIKQRAAGQFKTYFASVKSQAGDWLEREVKLPDRGGQWYHWYSCPMHGARLRTEGPTRHVCPVDQQVFTGYPYDDVVISSEHNRLAGAIRTLGLAYQLTGDARYAARAKEILLAYAAKYESYPLHDIRGQPKVGGGKVGPQTLDESTWLITVVEGADCIWDTLSGEEQRKVKEGLLTPATGVIRQHKLGIHNIQCWKNSAVGLTGLLLGDMDLVAESLDGPAGYYSQMAKGVTADGPWFEGAWGYHFYTLSAVLHLTEGAFHSGVNLYGPELKRMFDAPLAMAMPDLTLPAFNDSHPVDLAGSAGLYETALARYHDPRYRLLTARARSKTEAALLHGAPEGGSVPSFQPASHNFTASGNAILASGAGSKAAWLCLKYGPHGGGHGHPDKLNFVLYGLGQVIAPDPGTANYGVPIQGGWFRTTLAHNTLTVDEKSQKPAEGRCEAFIATNNFSAVMAEAGPIYDGVEFHRTVALIGTNLVVFLDQVRSEARHVYDLAYHNRGLLPALPGIAAFETPNKPGYSYLRDSKERTSSSALQLTFDLGESAQVRWALAGGEPTSFITGTGVGQHTEDRVPLIIARRQCPATAYLWGISFGPGGGPLDLQSEEVRLPDGSRPQPGSVAAVRVKTSSGTIIVVANPAGKTALVGDQQVEGRIVLLTQNNDGGFRLWSPPPPTGR